MCFIESIIYFISYFRKVKPKNVYFKVISPEKCTHSRGEDMNILEINSMKNIHMFGTFLEKQKQSSSKGLWLIHLSQFTLLTHFDSLSLDYDENIFLFHYNKSKETIQIWEMYRIHVSQPVKVVYFGHWHHEEGLKVSNQQKYIRRQDLQVLRKILFHNKG